jgi:hypothetical protein
LVWIGAAVLVLLGAGLWATARPGGEFSGLDVRLAAAAEAAGNGGRIDLTDATDFEWDDAHIFGSYTNATQIEAQMDGWSPLSPAGRLVFGDLFLGQDGLQLLAFRQNGKVTAWTVMGQEQLSQTYIRFHPGVLPPVVSPSDDTFVVERFFDGWSLVLDDR